MLCSRPKVVEERQRKGHRGSTTDISSIYVSVEDSRFYMLSKSPDIMCANDC